MIDEIIHGLKIGAAENHPVTLTASEAAQIVDHIAVQSSRIGSLSHDAAVSQIGHEQHNRLIALFDSAGARGVGDVEAQARWLVDQLKQARKGVV